MLFAAVRHALGLWTELGFEMRPLELAGHRLFTRRCVGIRVAAELESVAPLL